MELFKKPNNNKHKKTHQKKKEEKKVLYNDTLSTFYLWLYGIRKNVEK